MSSIVLAPPREGPAVGAGDTDIQRDWRAQRTLHTVYHQLAAGETDLWPTRRFGTPHPAYTPIDAGSLLINHGSDTWADEGNGQVTHNGRVVARVDYAQYRLTLANGVAPATLRVSFQVAMPSVMADFRGDTDDSAYTYGDLIRGYAHAIGALRQDCANPAALSFVAGNERTSDVITAYTPQTFATRRIETSPRAAAFLHYVAPLLRAVGVTPHVDIPVSSAKCRETVVASRSDDKTLREWARSQVRTVAEWQRVLFQLYYTLHALHQLGITHNRVSADGIRVGVLDQNYDATVYRVAGADEQSTMALRVVVGEAHVTLGDWDAVELDRARLFARQPTTFAHYTRDLELGESLRNEREELIERLAQPNATEGPVEQAELHSPNTPPPFWTLRNRAVALELIGTALDQVVRADPNAQTALRSRAMVDDFRAVAAAVRDVGAPEAVQQFADSVAALPALALSAEASGNEVLREQARSLVNWTTPASRLAVTRRALPVFSLPQLGRAAVLSTAKFNEMRTEAADAVEIDRLAEELPDENQSQGSKAAAAEAAAFVPQQDDAVDAELLALLGELGADAPEPVVAPVVEPVVAPAVEIAKAPVVEVAEAPVVERVVAPAVEASAVSPPPAPAAAVAASEEPWLAAAEEASRRYDAAANEPSSAAAQAGNDNAALMDALA